MSKKRPVDPGPSLLLNIKLVLSIQIDHELIENCLYVKRMSHSVNRIYDIGFQSVDIFHSSRNIDFCRIIIANFPEIVYDFALNVKLHLDYKGGISF